MSAMRANAAGWVVRDRNDGFYFFTRKPWKTKENFWMCDSGYGVRLNGFRVVADLNPEIDKPVYVKIKMVEAEEPQPVKPQ